MPHPAETAFGVAPDKLALSKLKTAEQLTQKLDSLKRGRASMESQWKLNLAFYKGRQYSYYNRSTRRIESLPVEDGEKPRYRVRLVSNQIIAGAHSLLAKFTKTKPNLFASPASGSDSDVKAAQMAEKLLEHWWKDLCLDDRLEEAILWSIITGQGYWKISWDEHAGKSMRFLLGPDGQPILEEALADAFRAELRRFGVEAEEKVAYMGDIKVEAISPFDVYLDPSAKVFDDCKYAICVHYLDPEEIKTRWGVEVTADSVSEAPDASIPMINAQDAIEPNVKQVFVGYFLPTAAMPNGRYVVWIDSPKKILQDESWPYPFNELPLVKFPGMRVPGAIYDTSTVEQAIPLQKELNRTLSQIVEYKNLTIKPRVWAPTGSVTTRITSEPGALYEYNPIGEHKPEIEKLPTMPPYVFEHLTGIRNALREAFGIQDITEGTPPPNVEAGIAIDLLQEMATDRIMPTMKLIENALARAGQQMLSFAQQYYKEPRMMKVYGPGGRSQSRRFTQADIQGGISVVVETGSGLPRTRAGRQARILDYIDKGILRPDQAFKYLDLADMDGIAQSFAADEDQANREHDKLIEGDILNTMSYEQALGELESGQAIDQMTGEPIQDPMAAEDYLMRAGLQPLPYENYAAHLDVHSLFMKSVEFESLPSDIKRQFMIHFEATQDAMAQLPKPLEFKPVSPTLQIKATAGPTAVSEILNKAGIEGVTPEVMSEPPLETWVSDKIDEPDQDEAGNDPLTLSDIALKQAEYDAKTKQAEIQYRGSEINNQVAERLAVQKEREARAKAELAEKKAKQSDFKPKPKGKS